MGGNHDDVVVLKSDVFRKAAVEDVVVHVYLGYLAVAAVQLDAPKGAGAVEAAGKVDGVEHGGERGDLVGAGGHNLTHDVDLDGAVLA